MIILIVITFLLLFLSVSLFGFFDLLLCQLLEQDNIPFAQWRCL